MLVIVTRRWPHLEFFVYLCKVVGVSEVVIADRFSARLCDLIKRMAIVKVNAFDTAFVNKFGQIIAETPPLKRCTAHFQISIKHIRCEGQPGVSEDGEHLLFPLLFTHAFTVRGKDYRPSGVVGAVTGAITPR